MTSTTLGTTTKLLPVAMSPAEVAKNQDEMMRSHELMRRYEAVRDATKPLVKLCKEETKKLRAIEDECADKHKNQFTKAEVTVEVTLYQPDPDTYDTAEIVVLRMDPDHEGEVIKRSPLTTAQKSELARGVLPGFENEPPIPANLVDDLQPDPAVEAWKRDAAEDEQAHSRVLGEGAEKICGVLDQLHALNANYPSATAEDKAPGKRGRKPKSTQIALPMTLAASGIPAARVTVTVEPPVPADESPWNDLPAPGFEPTDEQIEDAKAARVQDVDPDDGAEETRDGEALGADTGKESAPASADSEEGADSTPPVYPPHVERFQDPAFRAAFNARQDPDLLKQIDSEVDAQLDDATESTVSESVHTNPPESAPSAPESQEEASTAPQSATPAEDTEVIATNPASAEVAEETSPPTSRSTKVAPVAETTGPDLATRLMEQAKAAKAEREAKAVTVDPNKAKIAELAIGASMEAAMTTMLVKAIREAGSVKEAELQAKIQAKLGKAAKKNILDAVNPVLSLAAASHPILACEVDGEPGWRVKD